MKRFIWYLLLHILILITGVAGISIVGMFFGLAPVEIVFVDIVWVAITTYVLSRDG